MKFGRSTATVDDYAYFRSHIIRGGVCEKNVLL